MLSSFLESVQARSQVALLRCFSHLISEVVSDGPGGFTIMLP